jgi:hypothetical protein
VVAVFAMQVVTIVRISSGKREPIPNSEMTDFAKEIAALIAQSLEKAIESGKKTQK